MSDIAILLFGITGLLTVIGLLPPLAARLHVPPSVLLAAVGVVLGVIIHGTAGGGVGGGSIGPDGLGLGRLGLVGDFFRALREFSFTSDAFLHIFLPILLFETALAIEVRRLMEDLAPILLLAVVAVVVSTLVMGLTLAAVTSVSVVACLLLGAALATTDPAAVVGIFRDLGAPRRLAMLVEGESLLNDAAAIALFGLLLGMLSGGREAGVLAAALSFALSFAGGMVVGWACGWLLCLVVGPLRNVPHSEITLTVALAYFTYILAEDYLHVSGVVAVVAAALVLGSIGRTRISPATWNGLMHVWQQLGFWASSLIFIFAAMLVPSMLGSAGWGDLGLVLVLVVAALAARLLVLFGLLPVLSALGLAARVNHPYKVVMAWGGLRGAVSLALALAITENPLVSLEVKQLVASLATGFVLFTLFVNGTTLRPLIRLLKIDRLPPIERAMRNRVMLLSLGRVGETVASLARDYQIPDAVVQEASGPYRARQAEIGHICEFEEGLCEADTLSTGLMILATHEEEMYNRLFAEGLVGRAVSEILNERAGWLVDGAKSAGLDGYERAAERMTGFSRHLLFAAWLHRHFGIQRPLAYRLAIRLEALLAMRAIQGDLAAFTQRKLRPLLGADTAARLREALEQRQARTEQALAGLRLQYPDYVNTVQRQYLGRAALRREEAEYRLMQSEGIIGPDMMHHLVRDLEQRRHTLERVPRLDLGLAKADLVARVPMFADLPPERLYAIARLLRARLALPGERLVRRGDRGDSMFFISSGAVEVRSPGLANPIRLGSGDFFGEMSLLTGQPRTADVVAIGYDHVLVLDIRDFHQLTMTDTTLRDHIERVASARRARFSPVSLPPEPVA